MLTLSLLLAAAAAPQGVGAPVVINEFGYDDSSTDTIEFVELYNASSRTIDIGGWILDASDPAGAGDNNADYPIPAGTVLEPGDFWVLGSALVPNVDQVVGVSNLWENSNESLSLHDPNGRVIDTLVYEANKGYWAGAAFETEGIWGNGFMNESGPAVTSWARVRDGYDTNNNGDDFRLVPWTPGASNNLLPLHFNDNFDALAHGTDVPGWSGPWTTVRAIDPATADALNPTAIPASPQGGNAAIFWDESGGGSTHMLLSAPGIETRVECYVYFDANLMAAGEYEVWSLGIQGTTGPFFNSPDAGQVFGFTANGNTGVTWTFFATDTGHTLYLVDHNDGGWSLGSPQTPETIIATIPIVAGRNDGWQRLLLEISGTTLTARFGGTLGQADGSLFNAQVSPALNGVYVGYREGATDLLTTRPFTADAMTIKSCPTPGLSFRGHATAISSGSPTISFSGPTSIGTAPTLDSSGLLPNNIAYIAMGFPLATPLDLGAVGGIPGSEVYVNILAAPGAATNAAGAFSYAIPIPNSRDLCDIVIAYQVLQLDLSLPDLIPLGHSMGATVIVGL